MVRLKKKLPVKKANPTPDQRVVPLPAPRLVLTLGPEHAIWTSGLPDDAWERFSGALVRLRPPSVEEGENAVQAIVARMRGIAAGVVVSQRAAAAQTVTPRVREVALALSHGKQQFPWDVGSAKIRDVVFAMAETAKTEDREALVAALELSLVSTGL